MCLACSALGMVCYARWLSGSCGSAQGGCASGSGDTSKLTLPTPRPLPVGASVLCDVRAADHDNKKGVASAIHVRHDALDDRRRFRDSVPPSWSRRSRVSAASPQVARLVHVNRASQRPVAAWRRRTQRGIRCLRCCDASLGRSGTFSRPRWEDCSDQAPSRPRT